MLGVLQNRTYRHLFLAQVVALVGTGLATVALGLLAYEIAGPDAGAVLGTALAIKMIAYVGIAPIAGAFAEVLPRRPLLVALDLVRAAVALCLPFVTEVWQVYVLIFVLQSASAAFTPAFQATIPEVLPDEKDYTRALSLSRLAYDLESLISPALAAALLTIISFHSLFGGTVIGFLVSSALVVSVVLPAPSKTERRSVYERTTRGLRLYLATPRLTRTSPKECGAAGIAMPMPLSLIGCIPSGPQGRKLSNRWLRPPRFHDDWLVAVSLWKEATTIMRPAPATMATSARLNDGQCHCPA